MKDPDVSLVLPVYNETARLVSGLFEIVTYLKSITSFTWEIIVVDDGSDIPAQEVITHSYLQKTVNSLASKGQFTGVRLPKNHGKGYAIAKGVGKSRGKKVVFADIDGSVSIKQIHKILHGLNENDVVIASRRIEGSTIAIHQPFLREFGGRVYTFLSRFLFQLPIHDATCGFKAFRAPIARQLFGQLNTPRWAFDTEILALVQKHGLKITEVPVVWENKIGSKVRINDTFASFRDILKIFWRLNFVKPVGFLKNPRKLMVDNNECDLCGGGQFKFLFDHHNNWKVQECENCALVQVLPRPSVKDVARLYASDEVHFTPYIEQEEVHRAYFQAKLSQLEKLLGLTKNHKILDIGCLTGVLLEEAEKCKFSAEGLDISKDAVKYCKSRGLTAHNGTIAEFAQKNKRKKYDVITAFEIIEHEYSPYRMLASMYAMLNVGGVVMLSTPNHGSWWRKFMGKYWPGYTHPEHLYFFDPNSLKLLLEYVGFKDVVVKTGDSRPFPLWFLFARGADYFPVFAPVLKGFSFVFKATRLLNPINPWDDLLVTARK